MSAPQNTTPPTVPPDSAQPQGEFDDNPEFNEWLNNKYGVVTFGEYSYDAAEVIFKTDPTAYWELFNIDYKKLETEDDLIATSEYLGLRRKVCDHYPPMIAYTLNRTFESVKYKERLERLRDVWEAAVYVLHALIVAEYRFLRLSFKDAGLTLPQLFNEGINHRLKTVKKLLDGATAKGVQLRCHTMIPFSALDDIGKLNRDIRNKMSHVQSLSEWQAKSRFAEVLPKVKLVLLGLDHLEQMSVRRLLGIKNNIYEMEFEEFYGYASLPKTLIVALKQEQLIKWGAALQNRNTLTELQGDLWTISPFIHINRESSQRHYPELWFLKRKHGQMDMANLKTCTLEFEVMDSSSQESVEAKHFESDILDIHSLCQ